MAVENFPKVGGKRAVRVGQNEVEDGGTDNQLASFIVEALAFLVAFVSGMKALVELFFAFEQAWISSAGFCRAMQWDVISFYG
jgi:hypothetical protein